MTYGNGYLQDIHIDDISSWKEFQNRWLSQEYLSALRMLNPENYPDLISKYCSAEYLNNLSSRLYERETDLDPDFKPKRIPVSETPPVLLNGEVYFQETSSNSYLMFHSPASFTLETNNHTKNWDGTIYYSTDEANWSVWDGITVLSSGNNNKLFIRGIGNTIISDDTNSFYNPRKYWKITGSNVKCNGDIRSLLEYQNPNNAVLEFGCFHGLFYNCEALIEGPTLPSMNLATSCYALMFRGCSNLKVAPNLPATELKSRCYVNMFSSCNSLTSTPSLPATTLADSCYYGMFAACRNLVSVTDLPATELESACYGYMFANCSSLRIAPSLSHVSVTNNGCYNSMFEGCVALNVLPKLNATTLSNHCCQEMFNGCSNIKLSETQTGEYQFVYRIPFTEDGIAQINSMLDMFINTGGSFTGTPVINTIYYTSNVII